ncbi:Pentatricopeptide repeat [Trema orientale]|uniref:Pentatricopeptide repeat n=1 Tax=Trema orientale TaxID=63057 RepID=A0A2P5ENY0_TREOI|nr:Pentatricopeptide repeat [Trema orientale]
MESKSTHLANLLQFCIDKKAHKAGKLIHAFILRNGLAFNTFLSNRLVELYSKCSNMSYAHQMFDEIPRKDVYSWNAILGAHCKAGNLQDAHELFVKMPERNIVSWNCVISALVRNGMERKALDVYDTMILEGFLPTRFTLASVLSAYGGVLDIEHGRRCHGLVVKMGLERNLYVSNALLSLYAKCGLIRDAVQVYDDMLEPNEVTFTALMSGLAQTDRVLEALELFRLMLRKGIHIDSVSLSSIFGVCARGGLREFDTFYLNDGLCSNVTGKQVHCLTIKLGFEKDLHVNNSLLDMYTKNGDMNAAEQVFSNLPEVNVVSWNVMIAGYGQRFQTWKAIEYLQRMRQFGFEPDDVTYINMLAACVKSGDIETGRQMFDSMSFPSVSSWNAMLSGYFQNGNYREAVKLFREMQFQSMQSDRTTLAITLSSCAGMGFLEAGKQIHAASLKAAFHIDIYVASGLIGLYSKCGKTELAKNIFYKMPVLDIVCWNSMMAGFSQSSLDKEAFTFFKQMRQYGMFPSHFSYATVLSCCAELSSSFQGRQVHALITKDGFISDVFVGSALIDMYCKCGDVDGGRQFFEIMASKNTVIWNEMIHGYAQNGFGDEAVSLYKEMIASGEKPDGITLVAVLTACSHSGLTDAGIDIFNSMEQEHGVEPVLDHYTCIIDSLGRAGRFEEAEVLIDRMPYKDDPVIWEVLLSSCRFHANVTLAKRAADELFRLDPHNATPYVLLGNIYSSLGRWDDARTVRDLMNDKQVMKNPGYSWIEYKSADACSHGG